MKPILPILTGIVLGAVSTSLHAALFSLQPPTQSVAVGATIEISVNVSGLGAGAAPSLSVFDLDLTYDAAVLQFDSLAFGDPGLGDQLDLAALGSLKGSDGSLAGVVNHFEVSFDPPALLDSSQPGAFTLSVIRFTALSLGNSPLGLVVKEVGDALGDPLAVSVESGSVTVVPEPTATGLVLAFGLSTWAVFARRRSRR